MAFICLRGWTVLRMWKVAQAITCYIFSPFPTPKHQQLLAKVLQLLYDRQRGTKLAKRGSREGNVQAACDFMKLLDAVSGKDHDLI